MQRTFLLTTFVVACLLACGCNRSDRSTEEQANSIESSGENQATVSSDPYVSERVDGPQTATVRSESTVEVTEGEQNPQIAEVGCAKCMFAMTGVEEHELAIMIDGRAYLVTGAYVDPTESGLCRQIRKAQVEGRLMHYGEGVTIGEQQGEFIAVNVQLQE